jgi:hypothetical protein
MRTVQCTCQNWFHVPSQMVISTMGICFKVVKSEIVLSGFLSNLNTDIPDYTKLLQNHYKILIF